ncbi:MAG: hypothetical protein KC419_18995, partial [Anaerolineales bacterium]|nr:hypothetical protein [Anaerolineales bacterium]
VRFTRNGRNLDFLDNIARFGSNVFFSSVVVITNPLMETKSVLLVSILGEKLEKSILSQSKEGRLLDH